MGGHKKSAKVSSASSEEVNSAEPGSAEDWLMLAVKAEGSPVSCQPALA